VCERERERGGGGEGEGGSLWTWVDFGRVEVWSFSTLSENLRDEGKGGGGAKRG